jgi:Ribosomal protein L32
MRKEESGFPAKVKIGYGSSSATRGLHPRGLVERLVFRESDLESLDPKVYIVRISRRVGEKKRLAIIAKVKEHNFHLANPRKEKGRPVAESPAAEEKTASSVKEEPTIEAGNVTDATETQQGSEATEDSE